MNDLEEKKKEVEELFGKILKLILADLGLRMSTSEKFRIDDYAEKPKSGESTGALKGNEAEPLGSEKVAKEFRERRKKLEHKISSDSVHDSSANHSLQLDEPGKALFESISIKDMKKYNEMSGNYSGWARVAPGNTEWFIQLRFGEKEESDRSKGISTKYDFKIFKSEKEEKPFSHQSGNSTGSVDSIRSNGESEAFLFKASPTMFFQLYYNPVRNALTGNVYKKQGSDSKYGFYGIVDLTRDSDRGK